MWPTYALVAAFDSQWNGVVPYIMLVRADGDVAFKAQRSIDAFRLRRLIIANLPDKSYVGH